MIKKERRHDDKYYQLENTRTKKLGKKKKHSKYEEPVDDVVEDLLHDTSHLSATELADYYEELE